MADTSKKEDDSQPQSVPTSNDSNQLTETLPDPSLPDSANLNEQPTQTSDSEHLRKPLLKISSPLSLSLSASSDLYQDNSSSLSSSTAGEYSLTITPPLSLSISLPESDPPHTPSSSNVHQKGHSTHESLSSSHTKKEPPAVVPSLLHPSTERPHQTTLAEAFVSSPSVLTSGIGFQENQEIKFEEEEDEDDDESSIEQKRGE